MTTTVNLASAAAPAWPTKSGSMPARAVLRAGLAAPKRADPAHAISIARLQQGWAWELIDIDGVTALEGVAAHHKTALGMALRAASRFAGAAPNALAGAVMG